MAAASNLLSKDQFLCSICLDVFTDPVSTPCGHSFCKACITEHWSTAVLCTCPVCKKFFHKRPELQVNIFISDMVAQFRQIKLQQAAKPGEVPCDVCTGTKVKALKSCLVCLISCCETHLEPHLTASVLRRHKLIDPVENLGDRVCMKHDKTLELFCRTDQTWICMMCIILDHKTHDVVPLQEEYEKKKAEREAELQQMIQKRRLKIQEIKQSVKLSMIIADKERAQNVKALVELKLSLEKYQARVLKTIGEKQKGKEKQAEGFIKELEQEISELEKRSSELEKLSHSEDHIKLLRSFSSINAAPLTKDWTAVTVHPLTYDETVKVEVAQLMEKMRKLCPEVELKWLQQYKVDVTLDPDTANPKLILSDDGKQVHHDVAQKNLPDDPKIFSVDACVLGKQSVSSGRFYFEVQVKGNSRWSLGVARESNARNELIKVSSKKGYWTVGLSNEMYFAFADSPVYLPLKSKPEIVGVFVDCEEGLVSFYDVHASTRIYSFTDCSFTEKLLPFLCPDPNQGGENSSPLIISPFHRPTVLPRVRRAYYETYRNTGGAVSSISSIAHSLKCKNSKKQ